MNVVSEKSSELHRPIFEDCPDWVGEQGFDFGLLVVGMGSMEGIEVARAFAEAGDRLLDAALKNRESWEAGYPVLFCYRHALELYLKAVAPCAKKKHGLKDLWDALRPHLEGRYRDDQIEWLGARIMEFHSIDPRSTAFRYHDTRPQGHPELWVDYHHLKEKVRIVFQAMERVGLHSYSPRRMNSPEPESD